MGPAAAALVALTLSTGPASDRVLACRPNITGDPALARGEAISDAVRDRGERILDYGVPCESKGEAARAARRAGLSHAILAGAEGRTDGSLFELTVVDQDEQVIEVRRVVVPPGASAARPVGGGLDALLGELRRPQTRRNQRAAALGIAGGGLALIAGGVALAAVARDAAARANAAVTPEDYLGARSDWRMNRGLSAAALGVGGAAVAAGLAWRSQLRGED